jgi:ketosteroid isomerase-like protein
MLQPASAGLDAEDIASIRRSLDNFVKFIVAQDFDALALLYCEDAVLMPPHQPAVRGRAAIRQWMATFPRVTRFTYKIEQIEGRMDLAYVQGTSVMTMQPEDTPGSVDEFVKFIEVRRLQTDGSWLIADDIFNSDK